MKNGEEFKLGDQVKHLRNIGFVGATASTPTKDVVLVVMTMDFQASPGQTPELLEVAVTASQFLHLAQVMNQKAEELKKKMNPSTSTQH